MRIVADSDVLVYALHIPTNLAARRRHTKAVTLFDSFIDGNNTLLVPSTVVVEVAVALSRIIGPQLAEVNVNDCLAVASEIYPLSPSLLQTWLLCWGSQGYFQACLSNALAYARSAKDIVAASGIPGLNTRRDEVRVGGMDIFVLTYAELKDAALLTNDWSLWYVAWKKGLVAYWLSGLSDRQIRALAQGKAISYP